MEIRGIEQFSLPVFEPLRPGQGLTLRAMAITARVVGDTLMPAGIALFDVATQRRGTAQLNRAHGALLAARERLDVSLPIGGTEAAEYVRHFEPCRAQRRAQKCVGDAGGGVGGSAWGSRSNGLVVAQTVVVATFKYCAVVARLR